MGRWDDVKGGLAHREGIRQKRRTICDLCSALPCFGRRVGANPISLLGEISVQTTERYLGCKQRIRSAVNDRIGIEPNP